MTSAPLVSDILSASPHARCLAAMDLGAGSGAAIWANHDDQVSYDAPEKHTFSFYLRGGQGTWRVDADPVHGWPGAVCILPQGQSSRWKITRPFAFLHLYVPDDLLRRTWAETFDRDARSLELADRAFVQADQLGAPFRALYGALRRGCPAEADAARTELMVQALGSGFATAPRPVPVSGGLSPRHLRLIRAYVETHLDRQITLDDLSAQVGLSTFHLQRSFRASCGVSPHGWITRARIARAKQLIAQDVPLAEVAAACGFSSQSHLSRVFRAQTGASPGAWRAASR